MRLLKYELKKMMLMQKGVFLLLICFLLKVIFLCVFPEQKDPRIVLSQKQYDKYLLQLAENPPRRKTTGSSPNLRHISTSKTLNTI